MSAKNQKKQNRNDQNQSDDQNEHTNNQQADNQNSENEDSTEQTLPKNHTNLNHQDDNDDSDNNEKYSKTINLVSFGFTNGKPRASDDDTIISVRDMFNVEKRLRDNHNGTSTELQRALIEMEANKDRYDEIVQELIPDLTDMINTDDDEEITIFVGCVAGKHRSVAVVCMLLDDLPDILKKLPIENRKNKEIHMNIEHRDLEQNGFRKNKKNLNQDRSQKRDKKNKGYMGGTDY